MVTRGLKLRLPGTSANLGPGFDAVGLAMQLFLEVNAEVAGQFSLTALGRDAELVGTLERNLMVETYQALAPGGPALALRVVNEIPLGMGCGSSAAALVAGVMLANHFGELSLSDGEILDEACRREGHPDNVAACMLGGMTVSAMHGGRVTAASFGQSLPWRLMIALPKASLSTERARAMLPEIYSKADAVANVQATALLVSAFALGRSDLLAAGTMDRMHQPYRALACPLLEKLLPLAGQGGVLSVTLSGAGPSILLLLEEGAGEAEVERAVRLAAGDESLECVAAGIASGASVQRMQ